MATDCDNQEFWIWKHPSHNAFINYCPDCGQWGYGSGDNFPYFHAWKCCLPFEDIQEKANRAGYELIQNTRLTMVAFTVTSLF